jgi:hypothetical protein
MIEPVTVRLPQVPIATGPVRPKQKRRSKPAPAIVTAQSPETQPAAAQAPAAQAAIGALSAGGDVNPHAQQEVTDLIGSIDKRLSGLSPQVAETQKAQISRIRNFEKQAQEALASGDLEGAKTLATKAKLLLDDMEK